MAEGGGDIEIVKDHFDFSSKKDRTSTSNSLGSSQINILASLPATASESVNGIIQQFDQYERTIRELKQEITSMKNENLRLQQELKGRPIRKQDSPIGSDTCDGHFDGTDGASQDTPMASPIEGLTDDGDRNTSSSIVPGNGSTSGNISGTSLTGEDEAFIKQEMTFAKETSVSLKSSVSNPSLDSKTSTSTAQDSTLQHAHIQFMVDQLDVGVWPSYMRALGMVERDLETIRHDFVGVKEQQYQAFLKWIDRVGKKATPEKLIKVALKRKLRLIAERFCKEFPDYHYILESESEKKQLKKNASNPSLQSRDDVSFSLKTLSLSSPVSHTGTYSSLSSMNDQAVPNYQTYEPTPRQSAAPTILTSNSLFIRVLQPYMQNPNDTNKFYHEIFSQPFTVQSRAVFQRNVLEYQKEVNFQTLFNSKINNITTNWIDVGNHWASCVLHTELQGQTSRPPIFLWNFMLALKLSRLNGLYDAIKKFVKLGNAGPTVPHRIHMSETNWNFTENVIKRLEVLATGTADWRQIADTLGYGKEVPLWQQRGNGAKNVIEIFKTSGKTAGDLYECFYDINRLDLLRCMEDPQFITPYM